MRAFITGIDGFTGRHLVEFLKKKGIRVTGVDLETTRYNRLNLTDREKLFEVLKKTKPDYIFHLASPILRSDRLIDDNLAKNLEVDLFGTVNLLQAASNLTKKPRVLIAGTAAVYKPEEKKPFKENAGLEPATAYGLSKLTQELVCLSLAKSYRLPLIITRSILLIGPHQSPGFVVNDFCRFVAECEAGKEKPVLKTGNLSIKRDFTDVRDGVKAYLSLIKKGKAGEVYNVCSGRVYSIGEVVDWLKKNSLKPFRVLASKKKLRANDPKVITADNTKLRQATGWRPEVSFEESLKDTLNYWRNEIKAR
ncbi:MAG: GDP-D-mannose dehydratase [Candidatus Beckwithbacteria bacterium GW2011_GWB1_47_15]|uniref:GDP-D-mannose dehydratase n=1 Tax=Candidatus Beckwithbacteria bacterium GW2011_GWB1_47_15 TaxID=1618371 RepID=A0A0G1U3P0_9BACT|nr:MAG: GDP-D-mannose dehydratase [Candidatus Beckwithbacteria bacterium GW2011_GWC1_49_16]KKU35714.1 MAG: GDP-D-mannose dehydratase [Candidatus Beckwithbacteria bacterium GW2011_GWA1_46_30]KKU60968.1 MAG: GDP-D-mannose dehydratase [Candidatus Beckwithbacteria bacterium GW2011_GWB1_47_15]KKU72273.1 MAG: GDP-D-mannose dehydratase [Candidatus Beckwithbacteria bacterium GW2011_GWA2_47_25]KKW04967.1 MAG: GDP-D-mannose dehydratase [Candidatus Beckwithbacteria bacterium GW2011_GWC2_49_11]OGD48917.1 